MMVDLKEKEIDVFVRFCKNRATNVRSYDEVSMYVGLVDKLTNLKPQFKVRGKKGKNETTDASLKFHYPNSKKVEYHITHVKDGVIYGVRNKKLKLTVDEIVELKHILDSGIVLIYQDNWEQLAKQFDITVGAMQTYVFNIEIGTFDKWITKFLKKHECQTTLEGGKNYDLNNCTRSIK